MVSGSMPPIPEAESRMAGAGALGVMPMIGHRSADESSMHAMGAGAPPSPTASPLPPSPFGAGLQLPEHVAEGLEDAAAANGESPTSAYNPHRLSYRLMEPRVTHEVRVCGQGTFCN